MIAVAMPLVMGWEGRRYDPYRDLAGILTVCDGETLNVQPRRYTLAECDAILRKSLVRHAEPILLCLPLDAPLKVKAAFVSFGYNVGVKAACGSGAAKRARAGDYAGACASLSSWVLVRGKRIQGLVNRRAAERQLCLSGL